MRKIILSLLLFASFTSAGFYSDLTLAPCFRHLEATHNTNLEHYMISSEYLGYNGKGAIITARFGGIIKNTVAIFGGPKLEVTQGKNSGWNKDGRHTGSFFISTNTGITVFPLSSSTGDIRNIYITAAAYIHIGSGGNIGMFGTNIGLETGFLWQTSEKYYSGIVVGAEHTATASFYTNQKDEKGYSIWIGFKLIRK